ncbi:MAG: PAS domain S-box protein [Deltaproteobacteria bacterium]|nr:PAS domain S-box protein [Deltaproteobacteria bacterium]
MDGGEYQFESLEEAARLFAVVEHAKKEWETTFDSIEDGIAIINQDGTFKRVNAALADMVGMDVRELPGKSCCEVFPYHADSGCPAKLKAGHREVEYEVSIPWRRVYREASFTVPGLNTVVAIITDITKQRLDEERIKRLADEAVAANRELKASMRELKATQEKLVASEKLASLATMSAGLAHEINNPLGFVTSGFGHVRDWFRRVDGFLDEFRQGAAKSDLDRYLKRNKLDRFGKEVSPVLDDIRMGLERIRAIIRAIAAFVEQGPLATSPVDVNDLVRQVVNDVGEELPVGVKIEPRLGDIPKVPGSAEALDSVMRQLIENAVFAVTGADGEGKVQVTTASKGDGVRVTVQDNGVGMDQEVVSRALDPFFTTRAPGPHVGMGLAVAQAVVRRHGGELEIRSSEGKGTVVEFTLPAKTPDPEPDRKKSAARRKALRT